MVTIDSVTVLRYQLRRKNGFSMARAHICVGGVVCRTLTMTERSGGFGRLDSARGWDMGMGRKVLGMVVAVLMLAACESTPEGADAGAGGPGGPGGIGGPGGVSAEGLGDGSFGAGGPGASGPVVPGSQQDLAVNVGDRVFFGFDRSDLTPEARATLDRQAEWMRRYSNVVVTVEGHCDERGTREYNIGLGHRRASAVRNYLVALGIDPSRIDTTSYGKERPEVVGATEGSWAQNRRAVTAVN